MCGLPRFPGPSLPLALAAQGCQPAHPQQSRRTRWTSQKAKTISLWGIDTPGVIDTCVTPITAECLVVCNGENNPLKIRRKQCVATITAIDGDEIDMAYTSGPGHPSQVIQTMNPSPAVDEEDGHATNSEDKYEASGSSCVGGGGLHCGAAQPPWPELSSWGPEPLCATMPPTTT